MENKYFFSDFTLANYKKLLNIANSKYSFVLFNEEWARDTILLRHDLEFSVPIALQITEIEAELGIRSTYFVQLHREFYNTLEKSCLG